MAFTAYALVLLGVIEIGLRRSTLTDLAARLGVPLQEADAGARHSPLPDDVWAELYRAHVRATRVLEWWPFESTCLRRCLLIGAVARDHGPTLVIGVRRGAGGDIAAHSWLVVGGRSLDPMSDDFATFDLSP